MYQNLAGAVVGLLGAYLAYWVVTSRGVKAAAPGHGQVAMITLSYGCVTGGALLFALFAATLAPWRTPFALIATAPLDSSSLKSYKSEKPAG
jgi:hypothetical protein